MMSRKELPNLSKFVSVYMALLMLVLAGYAQAENSPPVWKATKQGKTLTLLGAVHYGHEDMYPLPKHIYRQLEGAEALVLELDLAAISQREINTILQSTAISSASEQADMSMLTPTCERVGLNCDNLSLFNPWYQAMIVSGAAFRLQGLTPQHGIDRHILTQSQSLNVYPLESLALQLLEYSQLPRKDQLDMLQAASEQSDGLGHDEPLMLLQAYTRGNQDELRRHFSSRPVAFHRTIERKSSTFAKRIHELTASHDRLFVTLGVEHLVAQKGVLTQLAQLGYDVEFVTNAR